MNITTDLEQMITKAISRLGLDMSVQIHLEHPGDPSHGDFATNVAMTLFREQDKFGNPRQLAEAIVAELALFKNTNITKIEIAGPGFINFTLSESFLVAKMGEIIKNQADPTNIENKGKKAIVEYVSPNTNKPLHIGHLRNAALGVSMINLLKSQGWDVIKATVNNDRGLHIMKSTWGFLTSPGGGGGAADKGEAAVNGEAGGAGRQAGQWKDLLSSWSKNPQDWPTPEQMEDERLQKPDHFVGHWYVQADSQAENEAVQKDWQEMLLAWENSQDPMHDKIRKIWEQMNAWFYEGYKQSAKKIGFDFDPNFIAYESKIYEAGREIILDGLEKGIFTKLENGAVQAKLGKYNLPDKVLLRGDGTGIYMTFDLELTRQKVKENADKIIWVVGNDQSLYFKQLFAVCEMLGYGSIDKFHHFAYGMVRLPEGKMSSRKGRVIYADDVVEMAQERAQEIMRESGADSNFSEADFTGVSQIVALGAVKWSLLSVDPLSQVKFDINSSVSFNGFAGPYLQYTFARCNSILVSAKIDIANVHFDTLLDLKSYSKLNFSEKELDLLRNLYTYFDIVKKSAQEFAPHQLTTYLFKLAQLYNAFYSDHKVLGIAKDEGQEREQFRLALTVATSQIIKSGLGLLGIEVVPQM